MASNKNTGNKGLGRAGYGLLLVALPGLLRLPTWCQQGQLMPPRSVLADSKHSPRCPNSSLPPGHGIAVTVNSMAVMFSPAFHLSCEK